jgi:hypothetical protein
MAQNIRVLYKVVYGKWGPGASFEGPALKLKDQIRKAFPAACIECYSQSNISDHIQIVLASKESKKVIWKGSKE